MIAIFSSFCSFIDVIDVHNPFIKNTTIEITYYFIT